jgi:hypothetical protein
LLLDASGDDREEHRHEGHIRMSAVGLLVLTAHDFFGGSFMTSMPSAHGVGYGGVAMLVVGWPTTRAKLATLLGKPTTPYGISSPL